MYASFCCCSINLYLFLLVYFVLVLCNFKASICYFYLLCRFQLKQKRDGDGEPLELTVYDYFVNHRHIDLRYSADLPCINVGKPKRPTYIPIEVNHLIHCSVYISILNFIMVLNISFAIFLLLALYFGVLATIHESTQYSPKSFPGGEIKAKTTREDEYFNKCRLYP